MSVADEAAGCGSNVVVFPVSRSAGSGSGGEPERLVPGELVEKPSAVAGSGQRLQHWSVHPCVMSAS